MKLQQQKYNKTIKVSVVIYFKKLTFLYCMQQRIFKCCTCHFIQFVNIFISNEIQMIYVVCFSSSPKSWNIIISAKVSSCQRMNTGETYIVKLWPLNVQL